MWIFSIYVTFQAEKALESKKLAFVISRFTIFMFFQHLIQRI